MQYEDFPPTVVSPGPVVSPHSRNPRGKSTVRHLYLWYYTFLEIRRRDALNEVTAFDVSLDQIGKFATDFDKLQCPDFRQ
jgi:hypothetical protein